MNIITQLKTFKIRYILGAFVGLYALNFLFTPLWFGGKDGYAKGCVRLEVYCRPLSHDKFDQQIWKESGLVDEGNIKKDSLTYGRRYAMIDDVMKTLILRGMEDEQVVALLGNPDGIVDKRSILASPDPYGSNKINPGKEILESPDTIAYWSYSLAHQWQYPAKSIWFPKMFINFDRWKLTCKMQNGKVATAEISF